MPDPRDSEIASFLAASPAAGATRRTLAGDASLRRYDRLTLDGRSFVLMDAPPDSGEDIRPFVRIAEWLGQAGFSAPAILAQDPARGLLLLEDLGDTLYSNVVTDDPASEQPLYAAATDLLAALHEVPPPAGLATYDTAMMTDLAALAWRWYRLEVTGPGPGEGRRVPRRLRPGAGRPRRPARGRGAAGLPRAEPDLAARTAGPCPRRPAGFPGRDAGPGRL